MSAFPHQYASPVRPPSSLWHYTNEKGYDGILATGLLKPSLKSSTGRDADYGDGQYLTDVAPGRLDREALAQILYRSPLHAHRISHYIEINTSGLYVIEPREHVLLVPNQAALDITDRRISSGMIH